MVLRWITCDEEGFWRVERVYVDGWVAGVGQGGVAACEGLEASEMGSVEEIYEKDVISRAEKG
jgi:hypothetical protein